ncbi:MAG: hypothetical protein KGZ25_07340, partial [Planctomycetes bacterium]|nr:hypothetical protein [Planctomycetota bacterium]
MDKIVEWFGERTLKDRRKKIDAFWEGDRQCIVTVHSTEAHYRQNQNEDEVLELAPQNLKAQSELPGCNMPTFFADFGPISTAKYWGGEMSYDEESENIYIEPAAESVEDALELERP